MSNSYTINMTDVYQVTTQDNYVNSNITAIVILL